ncbi:hypothetical protein [Bradyrhizobium glycinis]|uniref:hypothetical protein n=1 Tax=Bradyrhizobium glycinis TaxID=2751812 RepID=UPI0018D68C0B|nr:hypothetical protein [Bradyrhizobium glycinis]MBH5370503.1 hypothetical protein [Bradyrhizobium glycinis]
MFTERHSTEILHDAGFLVDRHSYPVETLELPFEVWTINLPSGEYLGREYLKTSPRGTMPALLLDDGPLLPISSLTRCGSQKSARAASYCRMPPHRQRTPSSCPTFALIQLHGKGYIRIFRFERDISSKEGRQGSYIIRKAAAPSSSIECNRTAKSND